jgi:hypothetical protein
LAVYTTGQTFVASMTTANTGACTIDFWPGVKNIKTLDGNDPQSGAVRVGVNTFIYNGTSMILQSEDFATATNKWVAEMATDAEVVTGTDESRYTNAKQVRLNSKTIAGSFQWTSTSGTSWDGTQAIAHWFWQTPRLVECKFIERDFSSSSNGLGCGTYDWTTNTCIWVTDIWATAERRLNTGSIIIFENSSGQWFRATCTFDDTNVNFVMNYTAGGITEIDVMYTIHV